MDKSGSEVEMPKKGKRKNTKDCSNGPKQPLTGYVRYINETRESVRLQNPTLSVQQITKLLAEQWGKMTENEKRPFLQAAEIDKERYSKEISEHNMNSKKLKSNCDEHSSQNSSTTTENGKEEKTDVRLKGDIPIFTDEFLEHNKIIDGELKLIRKSNVDYEQQNSVLEKYIENVEQGVGKVKKEIMLTKSKNVLLQSYLEKLKSVLANAFSSLNVGQMHGATLENIDIYMENLASLDGHVFNKARDIIRKLDL